MLTFTMGLDEAVAAFGAVPVSVQVRRLPAARQARFQEALRRELQRLVRDGVVVAESTSNIAVGVAP